jgi:NADP-dependent 3-hydroxy acid dehydrogenase YdfG
MRFAQDTALVTGAGSGIGRAIATALAREGCTVCLVGRRLDALEAVAECVRRRGARAACWSADLASDADIQAVAARLRTEFGQLGVLVHSAGIYRSGAVSAAPAEDFDTQYRTNLRGPYVLTQALLRVLRESRGQVVFINSSVALNSKAACSQYGATKNGLKALADSLREEVNGDGIRVLSVFAGRTATAMQKTIREEEGQLYRAELLIQPEDVAAMVVAAIALPRSAEVTEIRIRPMAKC